MANSQRSTPEPDQPAEVKPSTCDPTLDITPEQERALLRGAFFGDETEGGTR